MKLYSISLTFVTKYGLSCIHFSLEPTLEVVSPVLHAADDF